MGKESKGWSLINNIGGPDYFKISGPDRGPDCGILKLISTFKSGSN